MNKLNYSSIKSISRSLRSISRSLRSSKSISTYLNAKKRTFHGNAQPIDAQSQTEQINALISTPLDWSKLRHLNGTIAKVLEDVNFSSGLIDHNVYYQKLQKEAF